MLIVLPWPASILSPNDRSHWGAKVGPKADAKRIAAWSTTAAEGFYDAREAMKGDHRIPIRITFYPPDKRHRDADNMVASIKAALDGVADALKVNDRRFWPEFHFCGPEKPGRVEVVFPHIAAAGLSPDGADSATTKAGQNTASTVPGPDHKRERTAL